jgi:HK97 family phage portal protein
MDLVRRASQQLQQRMSVTDLDRWIDLLYTGAPTYTGKLVSQTNALQVSAVWACVLIRANDIARLPVVPFQRLQPGLEPACDHYLWPLLQYEANPHQTAFRFRHLMQTWLDLWGNAYAEIEMNGRGQVTALWPWRPDRVQIFRLDKDDPNSPLVYRYKFANSRAVDLPADRILHLRGLGTDGIMGLSPIDMHKQTVGMSMAITEHGARFFSNGARPLGYLEHPGSLSDKAKKSLQEWWENQHQGLSNAHRTAILEEGLKYHETGLSMVDAQYLESMKFTIEDIARIFGVPLHKLASLDQSTNNNIEQQARDYVDSCLGPLCTNWQQELEFSLLSPRDRDSYCVRFMLDHLIAGDMAAQGAFYGQMIDKGVMTQNDVREKLNLNPLKSPLADQPWKQLATAPANEYVAPSAPSQPPPMPSNPKPNGLALTQ